MQCNTPGLCLIRARGTAARIIHRRRNNFNKSGHGPAIHESPPRQTRKSRPRVGGGGRGGARVNCRRSCVGLVAGLVTSAITRASIDLVVDRSGETYLGIP